MPRQPAQDGGEELLRIAQTFRTAIERSRADKASPHLPYFPEGACRIVSRLLAVHLARLGFEGIRYCTGHVPGQDEAVRHAWLVVDGAVVDLTADPFGLAPVIVAPTTPFHAGLDSTEEADVQTVLASMPREAAERDQRLLAQIVGRLAS